MRYRCQLSFCDRGPYYVWILVYCDDGNSYLCKLIACIPGEYNKLKIFNSLFNRQKKRTNQGSTLFKDYKFSPN